MSNQPDQADDSAYLDCSQNESLEGLEWFEGKLSRVVLEQAAAEFDPVKRKQLYFKSQELAAENLPFLFTVNQLSLVAVADRLANVFPSIHGGSGLNTILWNSERHFVK
ncbi:MAG: hypothetical protein ACAI44_22935 [Candidatus Sericytochromatia bacterium]